MAGAVSAGAYTGGVMTRLFEIMDTLESTGHQLPINIRCRLVGGTSAGGVNAATAAVVQKKTFPYTASNDNPFYATWVSQVKTEKILAEAQIPLNTDYQNPDDPTPAIALSLVNAAHLDELGWYILSLKNSDLPTINRSWLPDDTRFFFTTTNLAGAAYEVTFKHNAHWMRTHYDWVCFARDESVKHAFVLSEQDMSSWYHLRDAALATSAFPVGLAPRAVKLENMDNPIHYNDPVFGGKPAEFIGRATCIDGGVMNNEPFVIQNRYLNEDAEPDALKLSIMIDPFPDTKLEAEVKDVAVDELIPATLKMFSAWKSTARFKPEAVNWSGEVSEPNKGKSLTFAINPSRYRANSDNPVVSAIASGLWGGFFGFMDESFRDHDFRLGYKNADRMLLKHFKVSKDELTDAQIVALEALHALCGENTAVIAKSQRQADSQPDEIYILPVGIGETALFTESPPQPEWPVQVAYSPVTYSRLTRPFSRIVNVTPIYAESEFLKGLQITEELIKKRFDWFVDEAIKELKQTENYTSLGWFKKFGSSTLIWLGKSLLKSNLKEKLIESYRLQLAAMYDDK